MVEFVTEGPALDAVLRIINDAYAAGESGLWVAGAERMSAGVLASIAERGELAVATRDGEVLGCIRTRSGYLGLLSVDPDAQGTGAGRELVAFAEEASRKAGAATMTLQLLVPHEGEHAFKVRLHAWYSRLGYRVVSSVDFGTTHPESAPFLAVPCDLLDYEKPL